MANEEHLKILKLGVEAWNLWRAEKREAGIHFEVDLRDADLSGAMLEGVDFMFAALYRAKLCDANLRNANLERADLIDADLTDADLHGADMQHAKLDGANFHSATLYFVNSRCCVTARRMVAASAARSFSVARMEPRGACRHEKRRLLSDDAAAHGGSSVFPAHPAVIPHLSAPRGSAASRRGR